MSSSTTGSFDFFRRIGGLWGFSLRTAHSLSSSPLSPSFEATLLSLWAACCIRWARFLRRLRCFTSASMAHATSPFTAARGPWQGPIGTLSLFSWQCSYSDRGPREGSAQYLLATQAPGARMADGPPHRESIVAVPAFAGPGRPHIAIRTQRHHALTPPLNNYEHPVTTHDNNNIYNLTQHNQSIPCKMVETHAHALMAAMHIALPTTLPRSRQLYYKSPS